MKKYLVLYEQSWMKNELTSSKQLKARLKNTCIFDYTRDNFKNAEYVETKEGVKIADQWVADQFIDEKLVAKYDGIIFVLEGERLKGRHGVHIKKTYFNKRFSIIQMEAKRGWYRVWKQKFENGLWELLTTRSRKNGNYKQIIYTFEHEIGHSLCWLYGIHDILHTYVNLKKYEEWWQMMLVVLKSYAKTKSTKGN